MLTIAPVVFSHHRRKDGTYNVKIRVTWKGVNKYIATNLWCSKDDLTRSLKIKTPAIVDAAARLVKELRDSVTDLSPALMENLTADDIVRDKLSAQVEATITAINSRTKVRTERRRLSIRRPPSIHRVTLLLSTDTAPLIK